jgi:hypothetical protein
MRFRKVVAIDFDGVIHRHVAPWTVPHEINDGPVEGAFHFLSAVLEEFNVAVFSARAADDRAREAILQWLLEQWPPFLSWQRFVDGDAIVLATSRFDMRARRVTITARKPDAILYIDDRGWRFDGTTFPSMDELRAFAACDSWTKKT